MRFRDLFDHPACLNHYAFSRTYLSDERNTSFTNDPGFWNLQVDSFVYVAHLGDVLGHGMLNIDKIESDTPLEHKALHP